MLTTALILLVAWPCKLTKCFMLSCESLWIKAPTKWIRVNTSTHTEEKSKWKEWFCFGYCFATDDIVSLNLLSIFFPSDLYLWQTLTIITHNTQDTYSHIITSFNWISCILLSTWWNVLFPVGKCLTSCGKSILMSNWFGKFLQAAHQHDISFS